MAVVILHILALLTYQNQVPQELIPVNSTWQRYFALTPVYRTNCTDPRDVKYADNADWLIYGYCLRLFWLYYVLALQSRFLSEKPVSLSVDILKNISYITIPTIQRYRINADINIK